MFACHIEGILNLGLSCTFRRVQIYCGLLPTRFFTNLPVKTIAVKSVKFQTHRQQKSFMSSERQ